ncbi:MAG: hypothetical protein RLZZ126_550 [Pseudomonadota bacterium]|jgi:TatD DNase family protein
MPWIDTHCHLDAPEFAGRTDQVRALARAAGVAHCVIPAVEVANFAAVQTLARATGDSYALGIHPLYVHRAQDADLGTLDAMLSVARHDPRLVAVGEIGLDLFVPQLQTGPLRDKQERFYRAQLRIAKRHGLPVILHVRRSADQLLRALRELAQDGHCWQGIAHAFNGSLQQALAFVDLGFKLGFGGAVTFERALQLRRLAADLPLSAIVLETDAPDIPPHWLHRTVQERASGLPQGINTPAELPRIAQVVAGLAHQGQGLSLSQLEAIQRVNAQEALPRICLDF